MSYPSCQGSRCKAEKLLRLIREGNLGRVEAALAGGADIDGEGSDLDYPPLVLAAKGGLVTMVKVLLERGANINVAVPRNVPCCPNGTCSHETRFFSGATALHVAVHYSKLDVMRMLLGWGGNPNAVDSRGFTTLHMACVHEVVADATNTAAVLLEAGADPQQADTLGWLPIHIAAQQDHTDLVDMLLGKAPSTLNRPTSEGLTPLCLAATNVRKDMVLYLLGLGAEQPAALDKQTTCPLTAAVTCGSDECVRALLNHGRGVVGSTECIALAMKSAVRNGRGKALHALLGYVRGHDDTPWRFGIWGLAGVSLLQFAVSRRQLTTVSVLLYRWSKRDHT